MKFTSTLPSSKRYGRNRTRSIATPCSFSQTTAEVTLDGKSEAISTTLGDLIESAVSSHLVSSSASTDSTSRGWSFVPCQATHSSATSRTESRLTIAA